MELRGVSLVELRRRYVGREQRMSAALRAALQEDPRAGARELLQRITGQRAREAAERRRLRQLFGLERRLRRDGSERVAGIDEVGVGPLAGPVVAAAVVLPRRVWLPGLRDSKQLAPAARERLDAEIRAVCDGVGIGIATREEIDHINIYQAGLLAMRRALDALRRPPDVALLDARTLPGLALAQRAVRNGDRDVACIAAASVVAKVYRDRLMRRLDAHYPGYGFARNVGYATGTHLRALRELGPSPIHRRSFAPVQEAILRAAGARPES